MHASRSAGPLSRLTRNPIARVAAYYVLLFAGTALLVELVPQSAALFTGGIQQSTAEIDAGVRDVFTGQAPIFASPSGMPLTEVFAMVSAFALMLPVTWIYILTRRRKGFLQSVVQTLVILPIVVAGVVFMVKNSLALAFSLGGIVAAVSFRNTLRDTKDAVYIFLATGVGLAAGIQSVPFAAALSITFNVVICSSGGPTSGGSRRGSRAPPRSGGSSARWPSPTGPARSSRRWTTRSSSRSPPTSSTRWPSAPGSGGSARRRRATARSWRCSGGSSSGSRAT
jgi:hypothetical protein